MGSEKAEKSTPVIREFCEYCGAGIGKFRRVGEGTCHICDPTNCKVTNTNPPLEGIEFRGYEE